MSSLPPNITLILPIRNEAAYVERCINAVFSQEYPGEIEILVVDGISKDDTREIVQRLIDQNPKFNIRLLDNPGKIVPTGMNIALRLAKGDVVIRVDGHCLIEPDYVKKCVDNIKKEGVDGVGGPMETIGETLISKSIAIGMSSPFGVGNSAFRTTSGKSMLVDTIPFPAYRRQIIERTGLYDEELTRNQDDEYNYRIRELGGKLLLADDVRSTYFSRSSLRHLWRQYYQYGYYKVRVLQKHPLQMRPRQFIPFVFVAVLIASLLLAVSSFLFLHPSSFIFHLSSFVPLLYLLANLFASLYTAATRGWKYLPLLPLVFAILHLSYGLGFLVGLLKFRRRWNDREGKVPRFDGSAHRAL